jgi:hypothetical protein
MEVDGADGVLLRLLCLLGAELDSTPGPGLDILPDLAFPFIVSKSRKSGSDRFEVFAPSACKGGLEAGETKGDVCIASGILSLVSNTKKASPPSPSFIAYSCFTSLTRNSTFFSYGRRRENLPKRT